MLVSPAAFKIVKTWLPEKAVQRIKFIKKGGIEEYVPLDQALKCWGGNDDYVFSFESELSQEKDAAGDAVQSTPANNRKVRITTQKSIYSLVFETPF